MILDEKNSSIRFLNSSSGSSYIDPFDIIEEKGLIVPFMYILTNLLTSVFESTGSQSTPTETITSCDQLSKENGTSLSPYLSPWVVKTIEATAPDVGDISSSQHICSHMK